MIKTRDLFKDRKENEVYRVFAISHMTQQAQIESKTNRRFVDFQKLEGELYFDGTGLVRRYQNLNEE